MFSWYYQSEKELDGSSHWGLITTYGGGGFVQNLDTTRAPSAMILDEMRSNLWLDRGTRAVLVDFTVYNANINLFCVIRYVCVNLIFSRVNLRIAGINSMHTKKICCWNQFLAFDKI